MYEQFDLQMHCRKAQHAQHEDASLAVARGAPRAARRLTGASSISHISYAMAHSLKCSRIVDGSLFRYNNAKHR